MSAEIFVDMISEEGEPDRHFLGIDGTMGDAQDVAHPYLESIYAECCRVCGFAESYRKHVARSSSSGGQQPQDGNDGR